MQSPGCSVIVAASNSLEDYAVALGSAHMQLAGGVELIALDDGSNGGVSAWLAGREKEWPAALRVMETGGLTPPLARNAAIEAAQAPVIAFLDPTCWWWPKKLGAQTEYHAAHPETAFSFTDYLQVLPGGESCGSCFGYWQPPLGRRHRRGYFRVTNPLQIALPTNFIGTSTVVASKTVLLKAGGFRDLPAAWEWELWLRLAAQSPVACSRAITATFTTQAEDASSVQHRIAAMREILGPYENSRAAWTRHAAAKARARLDCSRAEVSRPVTRYASAAQGGFQGFMTPTQAKAVSVNTALNFAGAYGAGK